MRLKCLAAAGALVLFSAAGTASAQDRDPCATGDVCASDPQTVLRAMDKAGLKPTLTTDNEGDPMIESDEAPYHFDVYFYGCEQHKNCDSLRFEVAFKKEPENTNELANKWNSSQRFLQASIKSDGRMIVAYDLATIGGVNGRNFGDVLDWWVSQLNGLGDFFKKELNLPDAPAKPSST